MKFKLKGRFLVGIFHLGLLLAYTPWRYKIIYLTKHGIDVNCKGKEDKTPIMVAKGNTYCNFAQILIEHSHKCNIW